MISEPTCDNPDILGSIHLLFVCLAENHTRFILIEIPNNDSCSVFLKEIMDIYQNPVSLLYL